MTSLRAVVVEARADASVAAVLVKLRGMTEGQAVAEVLRMKAARRRCSAAHSCKHSIYDPHGITQSCSLPLRHSGPHRAAVTRCPACHDVGWYLDYSGGAHIEPLTLELLPCIQPECRTSEQRIEHLSVNAAAFNRAIEQGGLVLAVGRG